MKEINEKRKKLIKDKKFNKIRLLASLILIILGAVLLKFGYVSDIGFLIGSVIIVFYMVAILLVLQPSKFNKIQNSISPYILASTKEYLTNHPPIKFHEYEEDFWRWFGDKLSFTTWLNESDVEWNNEGKFVFGLVWPSDKEKFEDYFGEVKINIVGDSFTIFVHDTTIGDKTAW